MSNFQLMSVLGVCIDMAFIFPLKHPNRTVSVCQSASSADELHVFWYMIGESWNLWARNLFPKRSFQKEPCSCLKLTFFPDDSAYQKFLQLLWVSASLGSLSKYKDGSGSHSELQRKNWPAQWYNPSQKKKKEEEKPAYNWNINQTRPSTRMKKADWGLFNILPCGSPQKLSIVERSQMTTLAYGELL